MDVQPVNVNDITEAVQHAVSLGITIFIKVGMPLMTIPICYKAFKYAFGIKESRMGDIATPSTPANKPKFPPPQSKSGEGIVVRRNDL